MRRYLNSELRKKFSEKKFCVKVAPLFSRVWLKGVMRGTGYSNTPPPSEYPPLTRSKRVQITYRNEQRATPSSRLENSLKDATKSL